VKGNFWVGSPPFNQEIKAQGFVLIPKMASLKLTSTTSYWQGVSSVNYFAEEFNLDCKKFAL